MAALISLHRIALGISDEIGDAAHKYVARSMRYLNLAAKDLFLYVIPHSQELSVTSKVLPIGSNYMVELPEDYVYYTKVGLCSNGRICLLGVNDDLCGTDTSMQNCDCSEEATEEITGICCGTCSASSTYTFYDTWRNGGRLGEMYGLSGGRCYPGYFKEDKANNRILLSSDLPGSEIILEYKADPTLNGINLVPSECELALREFTHWRTNISTRPNVSEMHKNNYQVEYERLKKLYNSLTADEWRNIFLKATTSAVKR